MRPKVFKVCPFDNPTAEERAVMTALGPAAISPGISLLIDADTEQIIEPALLYLYSAHGRDGFPVRDDRTPSLHSSRSSAYELAEWLRFLAKLGRRWDKADHEAISLYAHIRASRDSYHTGRSRTGGTIAHKLSVVYAFYSWFNSLHVTDVRWDARAVRGVYRDAKGGRDACDVKIRPFAKAEVKKLLAELGPLPSQLRRNSERSTRDRLVFETGLLTGMRGEEISHITVEMISRLATVPDRPNETQPMQIAVTKRRRKRWVALPNSLIRELKIYVANERARAMTNSGMTDHGRLFVNLNGSSTPGHAMTTATIHRRTRALMVRTGLTEVGHKTIDGQRIPCTLALHSFHDTRHTYAVNLYIIQKKSGDPEPWKTVQVMLGHKSWATTEEYYLSSVGVFEPMIGFRLSRYWEDA